LYQAQRLPKWQKYRKNLEPGTMLVMFHEDKFKSTRNQWDVGQIVEVAKNADGQARRALVVVERPQNALHQYNTVTHWRAVNKLVPIDLVADQVSRILPFDITQYPRRDNLEEVETKKPDVDEHQVSKILPVDIMQHPCRETLGDNWMEDPEDDGQQTNMDEINGLNSVKVNDSHIHV
jgi:hypothetical protein